MQLRRIVRIPTGASGLSEPIELRGYRPASIRMPGGWATANLTFRGSPRPLPAVSQVVPTGVNAGLAVDANAFDIQMANAVTLQRGHRSYSTPAKVDPIDISALLSPGGTINISTHGILWVFQQLTGSAEAGVIALQVDKNAADYASAIAAWAQFSASTRLMPNPDLYVPIGAVHVLEGGSGAFTWGTDSITGETEAYHNFVGLPEVLVRAASLALDAGAATFTYGAVTVRLGTGARIAATGKVNVAITGSNVATGAVGAWLIYVLADDVEYALPLGNAFATLAAAQSTVGAHRPNPMLALIGAMYVQNASGGNFVPGTTALDAAGITTTFETFGPRFENVYDGAGTEVTLTVDDDRHVILSGDEKEALTGAAVLQIRSGTSATPVDQTTSPDLEVLLEQV